MKIRILNKIISIIICTIIILGGRILKRYLNYRMNIDNGVYRLYDDQNNECGKIILSKSKVDNKNYLTYEYSVEDKTESLTLELIKTKYGYYYYFQKENSVYVLIKSFDHFLFDVRGEKVQNKFHLFCIPQNRYKEITEWMKIDNMCFFCYFKPTLERTISLHFGKSKID